MCQRNNISCYRSDTCTELCREVEEYANQDYCSQKDYLTNAISIEFMGRYLVESQLTPYRYLSRTKVPLDCLTKKQRSVIEAVYLSDSMTPSLAEIARMQGVSRSAVHIRYHKAIDRLRAHTRLDMCPWSKEGANELDPVSQ